MKGAKHVPKKALVPAAKGPVKGKTMRKQEGEASLSKTKRQGPVHTQGSKEHKGKKPLSQMTAPHRSKNRTPRY